MYVYRPNDQGRGFPSKVGGGGGEVVKDSDTH